MRFQDACEMLILSLPYFYSPFGTCVDLRSLIPSQKARVSGASMTSIQTIWAIREKYHRSLLIVYKEKFDLQLWQPTLIVKPQYNPSTLPIFPPGLRQGVAKSESSRAQSQVFTWGNTTHLSTRTILVSVTLVQKPICSTDSWHENTLMLLFFRVLDCFMLTW